MKPEVIAATLTAIAVASLVRIVLPPPVRLSGRVRPYTVGSRLALGLAPDRLTSGGGPDASTVVRLLSPMFGALRRRVLAVAARTSNVEVALLLKQAGRFPGLADDERVAAFRLEQLRQLAVWSVGSALVALTMPLSTGRILAMIALGVVVGSTRGRGRLERSVDDRRARMRIEIYTVNQLLAMRIRSGAGVIQAVSQVVERGRGEVVDELAETLRSHRAGSPAAAAFSKAAAGTPEPYCARTYSLLALAEERGVDLADGLLALAEDVREARREAIKRNATRRRAAMLVPTIAILAPVMLLFVGAPLPRIVLGWQ